jgi:Sel1 repeat
MQRFAISHVKEFIRFAWAIVRLTTRTLTCIPVTFGLVGAQMAIAECAPLSVPTIDFRSPTTASLRWSGYAKSSEVLDRNNEPALGTNTETNFMLNQLGIMYARGHGVPKSSKRATKLFRQLAMDGYTPAMVNLGMLYERGLAGRRDHRQAYAWIRAAFALGVPEEDYDSAVFRLGMIAAHLGAQTTSADRLALRIIARIGAHCQHSRASYEDTLTLRSVP